jgi:uncharacterized protein YjbI with pentapeptide repeats
VVLKVALFTIYPWYINTIFFSAPIIGHLAAGQATLITSTLEDARFRITNLTFAGLSNSLFGILNVCIA